MLLGESVMILVSHPRYNMHGSFAVVHYTYLRQRRATNFVWIDVMKLVNHQRQTLTRSNALQDPLVESDTFGR